MRRGGVGQMHLHRHTPSDQLSGALQPSLGQAYDYLSNRFPWGRAPVEMDSSSMGQRRNLQDLCSLQALLSCYLVDSLGNF